jgi:hypothetical protein
VIWGNFSLRRTRLHSSGGLLIGAIVHKLATGCLRPEGMPAINDFAVQRVIRQGVGSNVLHGLARGDGWIAQLAHVIERCIFDSWILSLSGSVWLVLFWSFG